MSIAISSIRDLLLPGLMEVTGEYPNIPNQWKKVFTVKKSKMQMERSVSARFMGLARLKTEGGQTYFDNDAGERYVYNMEPVEVGLGYAITRKAIDDNLYQDEFRPTNLGLNKAFADFWEIEAAAIFNSADTAISGLGGDGVALLSTSHPYDSGTWANTSSTPLSLNEAALLTGQKAVRKNFVDEAGLKIRARAKTLMVPVALEDVAARLVETTLRPGTANNDINAIKYVAGGLPGGYEVFDYFTSDYAWFLKTDIDGLIYLDRIPYEMDMSCDFTTDNLLVKGYQRGGFFYNDPRCVWGQMPTS